MRPVAVGSKELHTLWHTHTDTFTLMSSWQTPVTWHILYQQLAASSSSQQHVHAPSFLKCQYRLFLTSNTGHAAHQAVASLSSCSNQLCFQPCIYMWTDTFNLYRFKTVSQTKVISDWTAASAWALMNALWLNKCDYLWMPSYRSAEGGARGWGAVSWGLIQTDITVIIRQKVDLLLCLAHRLTVNGTAKSHVTGFVSLQLTLFAAVWPCLPSKLTIHSQLRLGVNVSVKDPSN